jgi:hypothetical protein
VLRDLRLFWPLLAAGGVLMGDDYVGWPGVTRPATAFAAEIKLPLYGEHGKFVITRRPMKSELRLAFA